MTSLTSGPGEMEERVRAALDVLAPLGDRALRSGSLGSLTTYRVGGPAAVRVTVESEDELRLTGEAARRSGFPTLVVGKGSNLLVADAGFAGLAVILAGDRFSGIEVDEQDIVAGAAVALPILARQSVEAGLSGFEWAVGVPGTVGGAVRMNAGGHGSDIARTLSTARIFDLSTGTAASRKVAELAFSYRYSSLQAHQVVTSARFALAAGHPDAGRRTIREIVRWRREHQPGGQNAGSVFTNPAGDSAGRIIEACGLKGHRIGSAAVSAKHANFIQADDGGSADDVFRLMVWVGDEVRRRSGVVLTHEVRLIGFGPDEPSSEGTELEVGRQ